MYSTLLAMGFALASALTIAWGTVVRHRIAEEAPAEGSPFLQAIRRPACGWVFSQHCRAMDYKLRP